MYAAGENSAELRVAPVFVEEWAAERLSSTTGSGHAKEEHGTLSDRVCELHVSVATHDGVWRCSSRLPSLKGLWQRVGMWLIRRKVFLQEAGKDVRTPGFCPRAESDY